MVGLQLSAVLKLPSSLFEPAYLPNESHEKLAWDCFRSKHGAGSKISVPENRLFYVMVCSELPLGRMLYGVKKQDIKSRAWQGREKRIQQLEAFVLIAAISPG